MRIVLAFLVGMACAAGAVGQPQPPKSAKPAPRYGINPDLDIYPQGTPKDALASVLKAIDRQRIDYLLAQLTDPAFVDGRVHSYVDSLRELDEFKSDQFVKLDPQTREKMLVARAFEELVKETSAKLLEDPSSLKELRRFAAEGTWEESGETASASLVDVKDRHVYVRNIQGRWFFENGKKPEGEAK